jgi:hypothetical protein
MIQLSQLSNLDALFSSSSFFLLFVLLHSPLADQVGMADILTAVGGNEWTD